MCGIAGIVSFSSAPEASAAPQQLGAAEKMVAALRHRGPDSQAINVLGRCVLGNTRLAIVDLSARGKQPMSNPEGSLWITYNGECYNARELRHLLQARGHRFHSSTDTEVVLHLYQEFAGECVQRLRGMFAFAIWDVRAQRLFLARDRLGIKPLYYARCGGNFLFASEIKALLASELAEKKLDAGAVRLFLQLGHVPPPGTIVCGVQALEPGCVAAIEERGFRSQRYWNLPASANGTRAAARHKAALPETLLESAQVQLMSDVPIALFLSGGIDSAIIAALTSKARRADLTALTIGFAEQAFDESAASARTAAALQLPHRVLRVSAQETAASLQQVMWAMDQPTVDGLNTYWISRAAAQAGFKVALSGQGGDELFGGYQSLPWFEKFYRTAQVLRRFPRALGSLMERRSLSYKLRKLSYLVGADDPLVASQMAVKTLFLERDVESLLAPALGGLEGRSQAKSYLRTAAQETSGSLREKLALMDMRTHLEARLLRDGDAMSMAHSLEVRPVFLDHVLVDAVWAIPASVRLQQKRLLLAASKELIPPELFAGLLSRPKRTFTFPFTRWLARELQPTITEAFRGERLVAAAVLRPQPVQAAWQRFLRDAATVGWSRIWSLFVLQRWCEESGVGP